jgi:hypothetical protein
MNQKLELQHEELEKINSLRNSIRENVEKIGKMNIQKFFLDKELDFVREQLNLLYDESMILSENEKTLIQEIISKYGEGKLDFATGVYTKEL